MRKGLIVTALLSAVLAGLMVLSVQLMNARELRQEEYRQQCQLLEQQEAGLKGKEQELAELVQRYENGDTDGTAELAVLREKLTAVAAERDALRVQLDQAKADVEAMRQQLAEEDGTQYYYLEVYNALTEGINKVKGYIAGN